MEFNMLIDKATNIWRQIIKHHRHSGEVANSSEWPQVNTVVTINNKQYTVVDVKESNHCIELIIE